MIYHISLFWLWQINLYCGRTGREKARIFVYIHIRKPITGNCDLFCLSELQIMPWATEQRTSHYPLGYRDAQPETFEKLYMKVRCRTYYPLASPYGKYFRWYFAFNCDKKKMFSINIEHALDNE